MKTSKICLIDDQELDLHLLSFYLIQEMPLIKFHTFSNAELALNFIKDELPELVISDWNMVEMSGIELIKFLKKDQTTDAIPVILCTGVNVEPEDLKLAFDAGAIDFIRKPFNTTELVSRVKIHLELKKTRDRLLKNVQNLVKETKRRIVAENLQKIANTKLQELNKSLEEKIEREINIVKKQQELLLQKSKLESLGVLAAGIAHEVNQPLTALSMGLENLQFRYANNTLSSEYFFKKLRFFFEDIERIKHITEHVRVFSREQSNIAFERVDVNEAVHKSLTFIRSQYQNQNIEIVLELAENLGFTLGNQYKLEQVFLNLLTNSKFAVDQKACLTDHFDYQKKVVISTFTEDKHIVINIFDNGIGISNENIDRIFDPFFTTKSHENGTGLGLSISYGIITDMKGTIRVDSEIEKYTNMRVLLPRFQ